MANESIETKVLLFRKGFERKCVEVAQLTKTLNHLKQIELTNQRETINAARDSAKIILSRQLTSLEATTNQEYKNAIQNLLALIPQIAPGTLNGEWDSSSWNNAPNPEIIPWTVRIGSIKHASCEIPILLPLINCGFIEVNGTENDFWRLQLEICLRILGAIGPRKINIFTWDPKLKSLLGVLRPLEELLPNPINKNAGTRNEFDDLMCKLRLVLRDDVERFRSKGYFSYSSAVSEGFHEVGLTLLFLGAELPHDVDVSDLLSIAEDTNLLIVGTSASGLTHTQQQMKVNFKNNDISIPGLIDHGQRSDLLQGHVLTQLVEQLVYHEQHKTLPKVSLLELLHNSTIDQWVDSGDEGVSAVIGRNADIEVAVNLRSANPPTPNCLIGGAVGQGKTNLLMTLIHSLAYNYSPSDLQFIILDLKDGVEFNCLGPNSTGIAWLPHVKSLGLSFDIDYAISVLQWASDELERRNRLFRNQGVSSFYEYRTKCTGEHLPRYILVIDEFHRIFETGDQRSSRAATLLEHLSRTGRSAGLNIILSSQSISGISELGAKSSVIFSQFHTRISLKNTREESLNILGPSNYAASELEFRGEIVLNDDLGTLSRNVRAQSAYATNEELSALRLQLWQKGAGDKPSIFDASLNSRWPNEPFSNVIIGRLATLENKPAEVHMTSGNSGLALIGNDRWSCTSSLTSALFSGIATRPPGTKVTILNGFTPSDPMSIWLEKLTDALSSKGTQVTLIPSEHVLNWMNSSQDTDILVSLVVNQIPEMAEQINFTTGNETFSTKIQQMQRNSVLFVGWWSSLNSAQQHTFDYSKMFKFAVLCGESKDDRAALCGPMYPTSTGFKRTTLVEVGSPHTAQRVVPFSFESMGMDEYVETR